MAEYGRIILKNDNTDYYEYSLMVPTISAEFLLLFSIMSSKNIDSNFQNGTVEITTDQLLENMKIFGFDYLKFETLLKKIFEKDGLDRSKKIKIPNYTGTNEEIFNQIYEFDKNLYNYSYFCLEERFIKNLELFHISTIIKRKNSSVVYTISVIN